MKKLEFEHINNQEQGGIKTVWLLSEKEAEKIMPGFTSQQRYKATKQEIELEELIQDTEYFEDGQNEEELLQRLKLIKKIRRKNPRKFGTS